MTPKSELVFLFDVDNTLLDNDRVQDDLRNHLEREFGAETRDRYWAIFEGLRAEFGYSDYLGALQRYRLEDLCDPSADITIERVGDLVNYDLRTLLGANEGRRAALRVCA
jgi:FMN phosphatase YigB (HAD superfamily)